MTKLNTSIVALRVSELPAEERPARRLRAGDAMSTLDLLAVVIGGDNGLALAQELMRQFSSLANLARQPGESLARVAGIGPATADRLVAAFKVGARSVHERRAEGTPMRSPRDVFLAMKHMMDLPAEEFHVLILDAQHRMTKDLPITRGLLNSSLVHPREVFAAAIEARACAIILVHNHPSGDPTPSPDDRIVTEQLVAAGRLLDIPVHDHIIVGNGRYTSFAETGLL